MWSLALMHGIAQACLGSRLHYLANMCLTLAAVCNHGVSQDIVDGQFEQSHAFFALPLEEKLKIKVIMTQGVIT